MARWYRRVRSRPRTQTRSHGALMSKPLARLSALAFLLFTVAAHAVSDNQGSSKWFSAWTISIGHRMLPTLPPGNANYAPDLTGQTIRMIVRPSIAGNAVRVRIE